MIDISHFIASKKKKKKRTSFKRNSFSLYDIIVIIDPDTDNKDRGQEKQTLDINFESCTMPYVVSELSSSSIKASRFIYSLRASYRVAYLGDHPR